MISCEVKRLREAVAKAATVVKSKSPKPILMNVLLRAAGQHVTICGSDLEISIEADCPADVQKEMRTTLPAAKLNEVLRVAKGETIHISVEKDSAILRTDREKWKLPTCDPAEFPGMPLVSGSPWEIPARAMKAALRVRYAADSESSRYALGGVAFHSTGGQRYAIGCDGRRVACQELGASSDDMRPIVPKRACAMLASLLPDEGMVSVECSADEWAVSTDTVRFTSRLLEGRFPDWQKIVPRDLPVKVNATAESLIGLCRAAAVATSEESRGIDFTLFDGTLAAKGQAATVGESASSIPVSYDGPKFEITLDPRFVLEFLGECDGSDSVELGAIDESSIVKFTGSDGYWGVCMPLARDR